MLTFISGIPGSGKTLLSLQEVERFRADDLKARKKEDPTAKPRDVYYYGINGLKLDWIEFHDVMEWWKLPKASIIVIDEAQQHFVPLANGKPRPDGYTKWDVHRHSGFDAFLITQDPMNVDQRVRSMSGRHIHLSRSFGMERATKYEWRTVQRTANGARLDADPSVIKEEWTYPKELYDMYKSAEVHTHRRTLPWKKILPIFIMAVSVPIVMFVFIKYLTGRDSPEDFGLGTTSLDGTDLEPGVVVPSPGGGVQTVVAPRTVFSDPVQFQPDMADMPQSAPAYSSIVRIVNAPRIDGCSFIIMGSEASCTCNDQRGSRVQVSFNACKNYIDNNGSFDPTITDEQANPQITAAREYTSPSFSDAESGGG